MWLYDIIAPIFVAIAIPLLAWLLSANFRKEVLSLLNVQQTSNEFVVGNTATVAHESKKLSELERLFTEFLELYSNEEIRDCSAPVATGVVPGVGTFEIKSDITLPSDPNVRYSLHNAWGDGAEKDPESKLLKAVHKGEDVHWQDDAGRRWLSPDQAVKWKPGYYLAELGFPSDDRVLKLVYDGQAPGSSNDKPRFLGDNGRHYEILEVSH